MPYVSAHYQQDSPLSPPDAARPVEATDEQGVKHYLREDSQVGDWLDYLAAGGTIDPIPAEEPAQPGVISGDVPRAEPDMTMDGNEPRLG